MYQAVMVWQAEDYEVSVHVGGFDSVHAASAYAAAPHRLELEGAALVLCETGGGRCILSDSQVSVERLCPESHGKLLPSLEDYERVRISTHAFPSTAGLNQGFASLAYGVRDGSGAPVTLAGASGSSQTLVS